MSKCGCPHSVRLTLIGCVGQVDVFAFAVIMQEIFSHIITSTIVVGPSLDPKAPEVYALKVRIAAYRLHVGSVHALNAKPCSRRLKLGNGCAIADAQHMQQLSGAGQTDD